MARSKQPAIKRATSQSSFHRSNGTVEEHQDKVTPSSPVDGFVQDLHTNKPLHKEAGLWELLFCVGGIYASFLTWAVLQERITTTTYGPASKPEKFQYPIFLNTVQSTFAAISGYTYLLVSSRGKKTPPIFPSRSIIFPLLLIAITSSLASPFGYASLKHIDYITFILAKSCKLLPVMFLHITIFRKRYPLYKYTVVALVTLGVAVFTLHHPSTSKKAAKSGNLSGNSSWGLLLLGINLLFDGLTNSTQDYIFGAFKPYLGPQMMSAQNIMSTILTVNYLLISPYLAQTGIGAYLGMQAGSNELNDALAFIAKYPAVGWDVLGFSACGAFGQVFIFFTLSHFSSLLLVTVTVTRKMLTMVLSVLYFGHKIQGMQWLGVGLVFGGVGAEAVIARREKAKKAASAKVEAKKEL